MTHKWFLYCAIALIFAQISIFGIYRVPSASMVPALKIQNRILINKLTFGLHIPFIHGTIVNWATPQCGDMIVIETKSRHRLIKRVIGISHDLLIVDGRRFLVPDDFVFVGVDNAKMSLNSEYFGLVPIKNILGKVRFVLQ